VIDLGYCSTKIVPIIDTNVLRDYASDTFPIYGITNPNSNAATYFTPPVNLASYVHELLLKIPQELRTQLKTIKLTGGVANVVAPTFKDEFVKLCLDYNIFVPEEPILDIARGAQVFASLSVAREKFSRPKDELINNSTQKPSVSDSKTCNLQ